MNRAAADGGGGGAAAAGGRGFGGAAGSSPGGGASRGWDAAGAGAAAPPRNAAGAGRGAGAASGFGGDGVSSYQNGDRTYVTLCDGIETKIKGLAQQITTIKKQVESVGTTRDSTEMRRKMYVWSPAALL